MTAQIAAQAPDVDAERLKWWGSAGTCTASYPLDYELGWLAGACIRSRDRAWWGVSTPAPETDHGGQAKTL